MKDFNIDSNKYEYISKIVNSIQIKMDEFLKNLSDKMVYEETIYAWINKLYDTSVSVDEAINIVHQKRMDSIKNSNLIYDTDQEVWQNYKKVVKELRLNAEFQELSHSEKIHFEERAYSLASTNLYYFSSIANQIISLLKTNNSKDRESQLIVESV